MYTFRKSIRRLVFVVALLALSTPVQAETEVKHVDIWVNALGAIVGVPYGGVNFKLGKFSLGPAGISANVSATNSVTTTSLSLTGYGGELNYYFDEAIASGWRLTGLYFYLPINVTSSGGFSGKFNGSEWAALIGYHWVHLISFYLGAGYVSYSFASNQVLTNSSGSAETITLPGLSGGSFGGEFDIGVSF